MTREGIKKHLEIIQAFATGKRIDYFDGISWVPCGENCMFSDNVKYRIHPDFEPQNGELVFVSDDNNKWFKRIFIKRDNDGRYVCAVGAINGDIIIINSDKTVHTFPWKYVNKYDAK